MKKNFSHTGSKYIPKSELNQFKKPYNSTIAFYELMSKLKLFNKNIKNIIDIGTGIGSNLQYLSKQENNINFLGTDCQSSRVTEGKKLNKNHKIKFKKLDILGPISSFKNKFDGLICIHALCCFKKIDKVINNMCGIKPKWIAINSLFFDGDLDVLIHIRDHNNKKVADNNPYGDFNIFSLTKTEEIFKKNGYKIITKKPYFPNKAIKKRGKERGSYTIKTEINKNTTFSGPVHLPWYFVVAKKIR